jgi:phage-related protein
MPGVPALLKIVIDADASKAVSGMKDATDAASGVGGSLKSIGKVAGAALGGAAIASFGKASVDAANESAVATARLDQIFRSMGDSTGQASEAAQAYASALSKKIGVEDESIMAGQAQLATFGEVSSESARMAGIFDRATQAGADLAAAGFGSIEGNAVQLGKALQDPTKGMTALAKSGVTFTDAQKDQIKALQDSGNLLEAQKIVLGAVEQQVGGTAEATVTSQQKAALAFGEVQETVGGKLLPVLNTALDLFTRFSGVIIPVAGALAALLLVAKAWAIAQQVASAATAVWSGIQAVFNAIMALNPIVLIVIALVALVAAIILAYNKIDWFREGVQAAFAGVKAAFDFVWDIAKAVFEWIKDNWPLLLAIITGPIGIAVLLITKNFDTIKDVAMAAVNWVMDRFQDLTGFLSRIVGSIQGILSAIADAIRYPIDAATQAVKWVMDKFNSLVDFFSGLVHTIGGFVSSIAEAIKGPINAVIRAWNGIEFRVPEVDVGPIHFGGQTIGLPDIPTLATGGVVLRTGMALVHEGETFSGVGRSTQQGNITVNITTTGLGADAPQIQRAVVQALRGYTARNGTLGLTSATGA